MEASHQTNAITDGCSNQHITVTCLSMWTAALVTLAELWSQPRRLTTEEGVKQL